jgi:putative phosphoribosyl transferase
MMASAMLTEPVTIEVGQTPIEGTLWLPEDSVGTVLFVNAGGSRARTAGDYVASVLHGVRLGTLWLDLLTPQESCSHASRFDIDMLTTRLHAACDWVCRNEATRDLPVGLYGASSGASAILQLAAMRSGICAIVSRGGRPDLVTPATLTRVTAPTLLIVGGLDDGVVEMNRVAYLALRCKKRYEIIPGATHSFEESGSLEVVARLARGWFLQHSYAAHT